MDLKKLERLQNRLKEKLLFVPFRSEVKNVAGCDASFPDNKTLGICVILEYPSLSVKEVSYSLLKTHFPYIPTFLSFRELPALLQAYRNLKNRPDLILVDGQGIAHPRGMGIAAHLGLITGKPTIGVAKSKLFGDYDEEPGPEKGSFVLLRHDGETIGAVVRTRSNVKPIFVSPGNLITVEDSIKWVLNLTTRYRLPEPVRIADRISKTLLK